MHPTLHALLIESKQGYLAALAERERRLALVDSSHQACHGPRLWTAVVAWVHGTLASGNPCAGDRRPGTSSVIALVGR
jgi:hypothetical protein